MKLYTVMWCGATRLDYEYTPETRSHSLWINHHEWEHPEKFRTQSPGLVINMLVPYRASEDVCELIKFLDKLCAYPVGAK